jgi:acyl-CoA hydrolase
MNILRDGLDIRRTSQSCGKDFADHHDHRGIGSQRFADERSIDFSTPVFPALTNHYGTLFGGEALNLMGRAALLAASDWAGGDVVMAGCEAVAFRSPVRLGEMLHLAAIVERAGRTSMAVRVLGAASAIGRPERRAAVEGLFHMVAVNEAGRPRPIRETQRALA